MPRTWSRKVRLALRRSTPVAAAALLLLSLGCGKKGPPLPPLEGSTPRVLDLEIRQVGSGAHATFSLPLRPGQKLVDYQARGVELWRRPAKPGAEASAPPKAQGDAEPPPEIGLGEFTGAATMVASVEPQDLFDFLATPKLELVDSALPEGDAPLEYALVLRTDARPKGTVSNLAVLAPLTPPAPPSDVKATTIEGAVEITWTPAPPPPAPAGAGAPATGASGASGPTGASGPPPAPPAPPSAPKVNVYRATGGEPIPAVPVALSPLASPPYVDQSVTPGVTQRYVLRSVSTISGRDVESDPAPEIIIVYADRFPPAAPRGLRAIPEGTRLNLVWNPNEEADLGGYHVYRRVRGGEWQGIDTGPLPSATFTDPSPPPGAVQYAVTSYDRATPPNESEKSDAVSASADTEP